MLHEIEIKRLRHIAQRQGDEGEALHCSGLDETRYGTANRRRCDKEGEVAGGKEAWCGVKGLRMK